MDVTPKKPVYYDDFYKAGITYAQDLFDEYGKQIQFSVLMQKGIKKSRWLQWSSLVTSVKRSGLAKLPIEINTNTVSNYYMGNHCLYKMNAKQIYNNVLAKHYDHEVCIPGIAQYVELDETLDWRLTFNRIYICTRSTKFQEFQFKFVHNILVNNELLYNWKISDSNLCRMCAKEIETTDHMIWECQEVKIFWHEFLSFIQRKFNQTLTKVDIYFGTENMLLSMLLIMAKQYVYNSQQYKVPPSFRIYKNKVLYIQKIEEIMYRSNNKIGLWYERWEPILN